MTDTAQSTARLPPWRPDRLAARLPHLRRRNRALAETRRFFAAAGYEEVHTPALQVSHAMDAHIGALRTERITPTGQTQSLSLHSSPEFAMKKLLAGGMQRIWQLAPCFRNREGGRRHAPEFAILEWYAAEAGWRDIASEATALIRAAAHASGSAVLRWEGRQAATDDTWHWISVAEAFARHAGIDILADAGDARALAAAMHAAGLDAAEDASWDDLFHRVMAERVEPALPDLTVLWGYPIQLASLARSDPRDPRIAERFELFVCGVELANGFGELTDAEEQRRRFEAELSLRAQRYGEALPLDEDFIAALRHGLPDCAGIALGFDRLIMLLTGAEDIAEVQWLPVAAP